MNILRRKGQSTAEYAILIALIIGVAVAMQTYVKRGLQAGIKFAVDKVKKSNTGKGQYEPYYLESSYETKIPAFYKETEETKNGGAVDRTIATKEAPKTTNRSGYQKIKDVNTQPKGD